jgi:hypothetical protein
LISSLSLSEAAVAGGGFRSGSGSGGVRAGVLLDQECELLRHLVPGALYEYRVLVEGGSVWEHASAMS